MSARDPSGWSDAPAPDAPDSIATELASRIAAPPAVPDEPIDWAALAATWLREAEVRGPGPEAAVLLAEAARIHEEELREPAAALALARRAAEADPTYRPALRAARRLAGDAGEPALAAALLAAEEALTLEPAARAELALARGRALDAAGRPEAALQALEEAAGAAPGSFAVAEELAVRAAARGDRRAAADGWRRCAADAGDPALEAALLATAAGLLEDAGDADRAAEAAFQAFERNGDDPVVRDLARRHAERLGRHELLARVLHAEAEAAPPSEAAGAWLDLADVLGARLGLSADAVEALERGRAAAPGEPLLLAELARRREERGDWAEASAALRDLAAADLDRVDPAHHREAIGALLRRAEVEEERLGRTAEAIGCCRSVLSLEPGHRGALSSLGRLCARAGDWSGLLEAFVGEALSARDPRERAQKTFKAAEVLEERLGDPARAIGLYREALASDPGLVAARAALERLHEREGRWPELLALLDADLAELAAAPAEAARVRRLMLLQRRAELLEEQVADPARARAAWEEVLAAAPSHLPALRALGRLHAQAGEWEAQLALFRAEADGRRDPGAAAELVARVADLLDRRLGRKDEAVAAWREVLTLAPAHLPAMAALARLARERGDHQALAEVLRAEAAARPAPAARAWLLAQVGRLWEERLGDPAHAVECYEEALRAERAFGPALRPLERLLAEAGRWRELAGLWRDEADRRPEKAPALLRLARLAARQGGDLAEARRLAADASAAAPGRAATLLAELQLDAATPARRAALRRALADAAPARSVAWLVAAAADLPAQGASALLARAAAEASPGPLLAPALDRLARRGPPDLAARHAEGRRDEATSPAERARWALAAAEAWARAGDEAAARSGVAVALAADAGHLPALRAARALAERRGDLAAVRALVRSEAAALRDRHGAAAAFLEAGRLSERLGDPEDAALDYRLAAELDPLAPEPLRRLETIQAAGGPADVLAARQARAKAERDPARAAEAWVGVARAALEGPGGAPAALRALDEAIAARPDAAAALELRARLRAEAGLEAGAVEDYEAAVAAGGEPAVLEPLHLAAAALCQDRLGDRPRARQHLEAALRLAPEHAGAVRRLARLHEQDGRPAEAADLLGQLAAQPGLARDRAVWCHVELARLRAAMGDEATALAHAARAQELEPGHAGALRLTVELERRRAEPRSLAATLEAAADASADPAWRAEVRLEAARLHAGSLGQRVRSVELLRATLEDDPGRDDARALLAAAYEESAPALAVGEQRRLLEREPLRAESWAALYRLFDRLRLHDRAYVAATVLRWLGAPSPGPAAERLLREGDRLALPAPPALGEEELGLLRPAADQGPLAALVAAAGDAMAEAVRGGPLSIGEPARADHPFRRPLAELARALGADEGWELYPTTPGRLLVEPGEPPAVLCGTDLPRRTTLREQRFLLGRAAARLRARSAVAETLGEEALGEAVAAAVRLAVPGWQGPWRPSEELGRRIARLLSRRARRALEQAARDLAAAAPPRLDAWRAAAAATADRTGLVLCGDVPAAVTLLARGGGASTPADGPALLALVWETPAALALLAFAASEEHFTLRQRLRVAIA
jgi:tetratricopeptide (TPR) repeat protein